MSEAVQSATLAERLRWALEERGMSQRRLAELSGVTEVSISRYLSGDRTPNATTLKAMSEALNVSPETLLDTRSNGAVRGDPNDIFKTVFSACALYGCDWSSDQIIDLVTLIYSKAQEPKKTRLLRKYSRPDVYADLWMHCEACGGKVDDNRRYKYCPECGAKVETQEGYEDAED